MAAVEMASVLSPELRTLTTGALYLVVFGFVFVESGLLVGFLLPGDSLLFGAGLVAASTGSDASIVVLAVGAFVAAVTGDQVGYLIGHRAGRPYLLSRRGRLVRAEHVRRAERFYDSYGWFSVVAARWIPWVRTLVPLLAGIGRMAYPKFLSANVVGALCWAVGLTLLGYASASLPWLRNTSIAVGAAFVAASLSLGAIGWVRARRAR